MTARELYKAGKLKEAIAALNLEVRDNPTDVQRRTFLFELLAFAGDYDRAEKQLGVLSGGSGEAQLGTGVELEGNAKTPQYQQALKVAMLNKDRNERAYKKVRDLYGQLKGKRGAIAKLEGEKAPNLDEKKQEFAKWHADMKSQVAALLEEARKLEDEIYTANQPQPHRYEVGKL